MKIAEVQATHADRFCYAKVIVDGGIYGIGEGDVFDIVGTAAAQIRSSGLYLVGKNPLNIEHHWQVMFRGMFSRGATVMSALSAIDVALRGTTNKYYNAPVYQLTGGKCRDKVLVYGRVTVLSDEELVENCKKRKEQGLKVLGHLSPFLDEGEDTPYNRIYTKNMEDTIRRIHLMRETAGDDMDLYTELYRRNLPAEVVVLIQEITDIHPPLVEDPIPPGSSEAMACVVRRNKMSVATGERLHTIYEFQDLLDRQAANYIRVSPITVGDLTGARKIATLAESKMCPIVSHNLLSPACAAAEIQLYACIDNLLICGYPSGDGRLSWDSISADRRYDMITSRNRSVDGYITPSSALGVGIDLISDIEKHFLLITCAPGSRSNIGSSVRDQQPIFSYLKEDKLRRLRCSHASTFFHS